MSLKWWVISVLSHIQREDRDLPLTFFAPLLPASTGPSEAWRTDATRISTSTACSARVKPTYTHIYSEKQEFTGNNWKPEWGRWRLWMILNGPFNPQKNLWWGKIIRNWQHTFPYLDCMRKSPVAVQTWRRASPSAKLHRSPTDCPPSTPHGCAAESISFTWFTTSQM